MLRVWKVKRYPFLPVSVRNNIVNFVNLLTCKQEKSTCLYIVHFNKNMFRAFCSPTVSFQDIPSSSVLLDAFHKWICSVCSRDTPLLLCNGMLLTCDIPQGRPALQLFTDDQKYIVVATFIISNKRFSSNRSWKLLQYSAEFTSSLITMHATELPINLLFPR